MSVRTTLHCPACGASAWAPDLKAGDFRLVRCPCGLRALDRDPDVTAALVDNEEMYGGDEYNTWYRSVREPLMARYRNDIAEIERIAGGKGGSILDIGCSYGWFLEVARDHGWQTTGIEATDATASAARESGLDVRTGLLSEQRFPDAYFDVVCLWDVLEHIPNVDEFLAECRRVLKPGGLLAVQSPNIRSVMARHAGAQWAWLLLPHHVWHFTPSSMSATLRKRGFTVEHTRTWEPPEALVESLYKDHPKLGSKNVRRVTDKALMIAEKAWCALGGGGLIRVYARRQP